MNTNHNLHLLIIINSCIALVIIIVVEVAVFDQRNFQTQIIVVKHPLNKKKTRTISYIYLNDIPIIVRIFQLGIRITSIYNRLIYKLVLLLKL